MYYGQRFARPMVATGAVTPTTQAAIQAFQTADQQNALPVEDADALYAAAKNTTQGKKDWYIDIGISIGGGLLLGYLLGKVI